MNKNIKKIIALVLAFNGIAIMQPLQKIGIINEANAASNIYLKSLELSSGKINFDPYKSSYEVQVDENVDNLTISAKPDSSISHYDQYLVSINGKTINKNDNFEYTISLEKGINIVTVRVEDTDVDIDYDDDEYDASRIYTLYIKRGNGESITVKKGDVYLSSLSLSDGNINFSPKKDWYDVDVDSSVSTIVVKAKPDDTESEKAYINGCIVNDDEDDFKKKISLKQGRNIVTVSAENEFSEIRSYTLCINRGGSGTNKEEIQDDIYLEYIDLDKASINFNPKVTEYNLTVDDSVDKLVIQAEGETTTDIIKIDGDAVDKSTNFKKIVNLSMGKNQIKLRVVNDMLQRTYTLNIVRGEEQKNPINNTSNSNNNPDTISSNLKINQWVNVNGKWQYNDAAGMPVKNTWFYDKNYGQSYYLDNNGNMATGWILDNNKWYYSDYSGQKQTGWKFIDNKWYYLDSSGVMKTGWINLDNKWYYLYPSGEMASKTIIDGYKIGPNGYWIK